MERNAPLRGCCAALRYNHSMRIAAVVASALLAGCGSHSAAPDASVVPDTAAQSRYFRPPVRYQALPGLLANAVAAGDIDGNGTRDLVVVGSSSDGSHGGGAVLLNLGDGSLAPPIAFAAGNLPTAVNAVDVDGDGRDEVAFTDTAPEVWVSATRASELVGAFTNYPVGGSWPESITGADVDRDGHLDLAIASNFEDAVTVLRGDGSGGFAAPWSGNAGPFPMDVGVADLDGDGIPDLAVADQGPVEGNSTAAVMHGNGDGTFAAPSMFEVGNFPDSIAIGDLNGDGRPDLVIANQYSGAISVLLATGPGTFAPQQQYAQPGTGVALADLDGDGRPEILITANDLIVLHNAGDGTFDSVDHVPNAGGRLVVADLNGDGKPDVASVAVDLAAGVWSGRSDEVAVLLHVQ